MILEFASIIAEIPAVIVNSYEGKLIFCPIKELVIIFGR